jgi:hypothetical protein
LTAILLVCACATVPGTKSIDELAECGARADTEALAAFGIRRHLLRWRHAPSRATIGRTLERLDGARSTKRSAPTWPTASESQSPTLTTGSHGGRSPSMAKR